MGGADEDLRMPLRPRAWSCSCCFCVGLAMVLEIDGVELFVGTYVDDGGDGVDYVFTVKAREIFLLVARDVGGDVGEELGEVSGFEDFIEGEELDDGGCGICQAGGIRTIGKGALSFVLDHGELVGTWVGESIWKRELDGSGGDACDN